jgi:hypothetical protein
MVCEMTKLSRSHATVARVLKRSDLPPHKDLQNVSNSGY